jgi:hypothetical protein
MDIMRHKPDFERVHVATIYHRRDKITPMEALGHLPSGKRFPSNIANLNPQASQQPDLGRLVRCGVLEDRLVTLLGGPMFL